MFPSLRLVTAALLATVLLAFTFVFVSARVAHEAMGQRSARARDTVQETMLLSRDLVFVTAVPETIAWPAARSVTKPSPGISTYVVTPPEVAASSDAALAPGHASVREAKSLVSVPTETASQKTSPDVSHDQTPQKVSREPVAPSEKSAAASAAPDQAPESTSSSDDAKAATPVPQAAPVAAQAEQKAAAVVVASDSEREPVPGNGVPPVSTQTAEAKAAVQPKTDGPHTAKSAVEKTAPENPAAVAAAAPRTAAADADASPASKAVESKTVEFKTAESKTAESKTLQAETKQSEAKQSRIAPPQIAELKPAEPKTVESKKTESKPLPPAPAAVVAAPITSAIALPATASTHPAPPQASQDSLQAPPQEPSKIVALLEAQSAAPADSAHVATPSDAALDEVVPDLSAAGTIAHVPLPKAKPAIKTIRSAAVRPAKPTAAKPAVKRAKAKPAHKPKPVRRVVRQQIVRQAAPPPAPPPPTPGFLFGN